MSAHTTYFQVPPYTQHAIPQGWRPPFQGPPPIPSGLNINPQLWQAGRWQPNPAYFAQHQGHPPQQHQQSWIASQAWQQPRAQESKNPYKRIPKPPSAEYLATRLSDNPLGLSDMIPAEEYYGHQQENGPANAAQSPWVWNPPQLAEDQDDQPGGASSHTATLPRRQTRPSDDVSQQATSPQPPPNQNPVPLKPHDPFTAKRELVPTFSINIVRTPEHYKSSLSRSSSRNSQTTSRSLDIQNMTTRMESLTATDFPPNPLVRHSSMPDTTRSSRSQESSQSSSLSDVPDLSEEPSNSLLSPLMLTTPKPSSRVLGRHSTFPLVNNGSAATLDTIHESTTTSSSDQSYSTPTRRKSRNPARVQTEPADVYRTQHSPKYSITNNTSPPSHPSSSQSPRSSYTTSQHSSPNASTQSPHDHQITPPTSGSSRHSNPLPQPPRGLRKGYWNKRGDHLTMDGFIVYAPHDQTYPSELQDYPDPAVGYRDEKGQMAKFYDRPELQDSRPRLGQPPLRPYNSFIEYV